MARMDKNEVYDEMCHVLTDYEEDKASGSSSHHMLVKIQNNWEELTDKDNI